MGFDKESEMTILDEFIPVIENTFIDRPMSNEPLPTFEGSKSKLPQPLWDNHKDYIDCYWKAWELAFKNLRRPHESTGFVSNFIDTAFDGCTFMWDSVFMLMFGKYADRIFKFQGTLDNFYSHQHDDGFICRQIDAVTGKDMFTRWDPSATGPEIMAWCEWEYFLNFGDIERLKRVFPVLLSYHRFLKETHTWPDGTYFSSGWGCGMDNLPRQQKGYSEPFSHGHMIWVDACAQALYDCRVLIKMAEVLGKNEYIEELDIEANMLFKVINEKLWDEKTNFYYDLWKNGEFNYVHHAGAFWNLLAETVPQNRVEKFIANLNDEKLFKTPNRVPCLAKDNSEYESTGGYWCGGVWAPTNYMILKGLDKYKKYDLSHTIAMEHLYAVVEVFKDTNTVFENYAPEYVNNGRPSQGKPAMKDFVGWTGISPISILFEFVFGIKPDAENNRIIWDVTLLDKHGIEQYPFKTDGELTLICNERKSEDEKPQITFKSNIPLELEIIWGSENNKQSMIINS